MFLSHRGSWWFFCESGRFRLPVLSSRYLSSKPISLLFDLRNVTAAVLPLLQETFRNLALMKTLTLFTLLTLSALPALGDSLGAVDITPPDGWRGESTSAGSLPTMRYRADGHSAEIIVTVLPAAVGDVQDAETLQNFHKAVCAPFLSEGNVQYSPHAVPGKGVIGWYATFEDPSRVGKPAKAGDYKVATSVLVWVPKEHVVHATILTDKVDSPDIVAGLKMAASAHLAQPETAASGGKSNGAEKSGGLESTPSK